MKKLVSVIAAAAVLLGSTIAYASASEPSGRLTSEEHLDINAPDTEKIEFTSVPADEPNAEVHADNDDIEDQASLLEYRERDDGTLEVMCAYENRKKITNVVIPSDVNGVPVTSIQYSAFHGCSNLISAEIPESVTNIGLCAFTDCTSLLEINIAEKNPNYCSEDGVLFTKDKTTLIQYPVGNARENYEIPEGVTSIRGMIDGGKVIYGSAFTGCTNLKSVTIPKSIPIIEDVFSGCANLTTVTISDGVKTIGICAFMDCSNLTTVKIPDSITAIKDRAFEGCTNLTSITLSKEVTEIGKNAFSKCTSLTSVIIPESVTLIKERTFYKCTNLSSIIIPEEIISIGDEAFYECASLSLITIPKTVTSIGSYAFYNCASLPSVTIPDSVTSIGSNAFFGCTGLSEINVGGNNSYYCSVDGVLFSRDKSLLIQYPVNNSRKSFEIPMGAVTIDSCSFWGCKNLTLLIIPDGVTTIGVSAFNRCQDLKSVRIPKSITTIGKNAFYMCSNLVSIAIPNGVTRIEDRTFEDCTSLRSVIIPDSVEAIGYSAFENSGIESIRLPKNITKIDSSFSNCQNLKIIKIPKSIKEIHYGYYMKRLTDVYYEGSEEDWAKIGWIGYHSGSDNYEDSSWWEVHWNIEDIFNYTHTYTYGVLLDATMHYNVPYDELLQDSTVTITIPKPIESVPETSNTQLSVSLNDSIIDTIPINDDGTLDISTVPDGEYTFTFSADHCAPRSYTASVLSGSLSGLDDGVELRLYGDVDDAGDGIVDIRDVAKANQYFKTGEGLSGYMLTVSDVNRDGVIDIRDVAQMNAHFKGAGNLWE